MSDIHSRPLRLRDLSEYAVFNETPHVPTPSARPKVYANRSRWSGRKAWYWIMIHPLWPGSSVAHGPFWRPGDAADDARKYLNTRAWS